MDIHRGQAITRELLRGLDKNKYGASIRGGRGIRSNAGMSGASLDIVEKEKVNDNVINCVCQSRNIYPYCPVELIEHTFSYDRGAIPGCRLCHIPHWSRVGIAQKKAFRAGEVIPVQVSGISLVMYSKFETVEPGDRLCVMRYSRVAHKSPGGNLLVLAVYNEGTTPDPSWCITVNGDTECYNYALVEITTERLDNIYITDDEESNYGTFEVLVLGGGYVATESNPGEIAISGGTFGTTTGAP